MEKKDYFRNVLVDILRNILLKREISGSHNGVDQIQGLCNSKPCLLVSSYRHWVGSRGLQKVRTKLIDLEGEGRVK